jgi:hypothetical protein
LEGLSLARLLGIAANNLDLVRLHGLTAIVHLERDVFDQKGPYFVAEPVRVEAPLLSTNCVSMNSCPDFCFTLSGSVPSFATTHGYGAYLELQPALYVLLQRFRDGLVKVAQNLHRKLRVYALLADQVVERVRQSEPYAVLWWQVLAGYLMRPRIILARPSPGVKYLLRR